MVNFLWVSAKNYRKLLKEAAAASSERTSTMHAAYTISISPFDYQFLSLQL